MKTGNLIKSSWEEVYSKQPRAYDNFVKHVCSKILKNKRTNLASALVLEKFPRKKEDFLKLFTVRAKRNFRSICVRAREDFISSLVASGISAYELEIEYVWNVHVPWWKSNLDLSVF